MVDILALENRWYRYKIKSLLPLVGGGVSVVVLLSISLYFSETTQKEEKITLTHPQAVTKTIEKIKTIPKKETIIKEKSSQIQEKKTTQQKTLLTPSMSFLTSIKEPQKIKNKSEPQVKRTQLKEKQTTPQQVNIVRNKSSQDIKEVLQRFNNTNNPALSLFIAKKYYEMGEFKKAYNYALKTNELDSNIDASWILFTKSLVKLEKKEMALEILQRYIKHSHSQQAQQLSNEIKNGVFK